MVKRTGYFMLRTEDEEGNISKLSNIARVYFIPPQTNNINTHIKVT